MHYFQLMLLALSLTAIHASIYSNLKENVQSFLNELQRGKDKSPIRRDSPMRFYYKEHEDAKDKKAARLKANVLKKIRTYEQNLKTGRAMPSSLTGQRDAKTEREYFHMDPVLNDIRHRRIAIKRRKGTDDSDGTTSSSDEQFWKDQWSEHWMQKKFEALNSTQPRGDVVNMAAARPWGVPCGDPNQHDMPWGSCMLAPECEAEYRIYRGDYFCGRTSYICCALQITNYDMYQGLDMSFEGSSFQTDSNEKNREDEKKNEKKKRNSQKRRRKRERDRRKKRIEKSIRRIVREIRSLLQKAYRNGTAQRKKKTRELKRLIELMKRQYRKDRKSVVDVHEYELTKIDDKLQAKLDKIKGVNVNYMHNDTFRDIVVNGTINEEKLRNFLRAHPDLADLFKHRRTGLNLKPGGVLELDSNSEMEGSKSEVEEPKLEIVKPKPKKRRHRMLDYDVEYGMLYY